MHLITNILNYRVGEDKLDWDNRNLRIMNGISAILTLTMLFFNLLAFVMGFNNLIPLTMSGLILGAMFFVIPNNMGLNFLKFYWCILPILIAFSFGLFAIGPKGNDKYYLLLCAALPMIVFKSNKYIAIISGIAVACFLSLDYTQHIFPPLIHLNAFELQFFKTSNNVFFVIFLISMFGLFKRENDEYQVEVNKQKDQIEQKNLEVKQSIEYAKNLQDALMPRYESFQSVFKDCFILYEPKDIVAGDFYWMIEKENAVFFAVADCTGHGVPGAMVSVICCTALNRCLNEENLSEPKDILFRSRELVVEAFKMASKSVKDGMDIALCKYDRTTQLITFSGANNGFYHVRDNELNEYKANKQAIGFLDDPKPFTQVEIKVNKGDRIYLFSDGFIDQFGGEKGKKYKSRAFKKFLLETENHTMLHQGDLLMKELNNWKGQLEQIDDICVIGIKF